MLQQDTITLNAFPLLDLDVRYFYHPNRPDAPHSIWWRPRSDAKPLVRQSPEVPRGYLTSYRDKSRTDEMIEAIQRIQQILQF